MDKKTDLVFEYFEKKYGFDIQKLGIDKYQIQHIFQNNHRYFNKKDSIKILILHIEKMIDAQIKDNKKKIISQDFLENKPIMKIINDDIGNSNINKHISFNNREVTVEKIKSRRIFIDSKDRNFSQYKFPSYFVFPLKEPLKKEFTIKEVILRSTEKENDSSDNLERIPYLILDFSIGKSEGSNDFLEGTSSILSNYDVKGDYRYYSINEKITLDKNLKDIIVKIRKPNGEIYNFGTNNNEFMYTVLFINLEGF